MVRFFHHIVACEAFYVYNNIVIYLECRKTVPEELLHPAYMYPSCNQVSCNQVTRSNWCFSFAPELVGYSAPRDLHRRAAYSVCESWFLIHQDVYHDLFVCS